MGNDFASTGQSAFGPLHPKPNSDWEVQRAIRTVAHHATDAADCAELLEMLDLDPKKGKDGTSSSQAAGDSTPPRRAVQRRWNTISNRLT